MGGRYTRLSATRTMREVVGQRAGGGGGETQNQQNTAGGGGGATEFTSQNGTKVAAGGATDEQIRAALGDRFSREVVANIIGGGKGHTLTLSVYGTSVSGISENAKFRTNFDLIRQNDGSVRFVGGTLFSKDRTLAGIQAVQGGAVRSLISNIKYAVNGNYIQSLIVPSAIGSAGSRTELGSSLWARLGANAQLSAPERTRLQNDTTLPASVRNATSISALMKSKEGQRWWENNRRTFTGEIDFRVRQGDSFDVWGRFLRG